MLKKNQPVRRRGFTLIEMIVAIGIFSAMMVVAVGMFTKLNSTQRLNQTKLDLLNDVRFSLDLMGTEILFGYAFPPTPVSFPGGCSAGCSPSESTDKFIFGTKIRSDIPARLIEYYLDTTTGRIMRGEQKFFGPCFTTPFPTTDCYAPLTSAKVKITQLTYTVSNKGADLQPIITVTVSGVVQSEKFQLSSTYSPRYLQDPSAVPPTDNQLPTIQITSPPPPTYTTSATNVDISGIATDNVGVVSVMWANQTSGVNGSAVPTSAGYSTWDASNVPLLFGNNTIVVTAIDAAGNIGTAQIDVFSSATPPPPTIDARQNCTGSGPGIWVDWPIVTGATDYTLYRCSGVCTPTTVDAIGNTTCIYNPGFIFFNDKQNVFEGCSGSATSPGGAPGTTWSYAVRAFFSGIYGAFSSVVTQDQPTCTLISPPVCGNLLCETGEDNLNCSLDCAAPFCGDGICNGGEDNSTCSVDCPVPFCGDGICNGGEDNSTCSVDCPATPGTFSLEVSYPPVMVVHVTGNGNGSRTSKSVTVSVIDAGYGGSVSFSCGGLPPNSVCNFSPPSASSPGSSSLRITVRDNVADVDTDFPITIVGQGGGKTKYASAVLHVIIGGVNQN